MLVTTKDRNDPAEVERLKKMTKDEDDEIQKKILEKYKTKTNYYLEKLTW